MHRKSIGNRCITTLFWSGLLASIVWAAGCGSGDTETTAPTTNQNLGPQSKKAPEDPALKFKKKLSAQPG